MCQNKRFSSKFNRDRHLKNFHMNENINHFNCQFCDLIFNDIKSLKNHKIKHKPITKFEKD